MNSDLQAVEAFLESGGMHPRSVELPATADHMLGEMEKGLKGETSSLAMIPTYIQTDSGIPAGQTAIVLDAGGTNLRAARLSFDSGRRPRIDQYSKSPMPGTRGEEVSLNDFFNALADLVKPLVRSDENIGFCFSYPTEIFPNRDGRLIHWSKEVNAPEVEGAVIGEELCAALKRKGVNSEHQMTLLNDTVATLLAGKALADDRHWGGFAGIILGTGLNSCCSLPNASIGKIDGLDADKNQIINFEAGNYACQSRGEADRILGAMTAKPETYWLEKMVSGGYFGALSAQVIKLAAGRGLFSASAAKALAQIGELSTRDADNYMHNPFSADNQLVQIMREHASKADAVRLWFLQDALLERAARLTASVLGASVLAGQSETGPLHPVCLTIDGTTFYRYYRFQHRVESLLRPFLTERDYFYESIRVEDAPMIGAAAAALTHGRND